MATNLFSFTPRTTFRVRGRICLMIFLMSKDIQAYSWNMLHYDGIKPGQSHWLQWCHLSFQPLHPAVPAELRQLPWLPQSQTWISGPIWLGRGSFILQVCHGWQWLFLERLLMFVSILDLPKIMALAWEGPDPVLICFTGGFLAHNFEPELNKNWKTKNKSRQKIGDQRFCLWNIPGY